MTTATESVPAAAAAAAATQPKSLLLRVRDETAFAHRQLESELALLSPSLDEARYVRVLRAFHAFLAPWEEARAAAVRTDPATAAFFADRSHAGRAAADLDALHVHALYVDAPHPDRVALTAGHAPELPAMSTPAAIWGSSYVIEGSTLGGKLISRSLEDAFGYTSEHGCAYFAGYGAENGRRWAAFTSAMMHAVPHQAADEAIAAAVDTYACLHGWLSATGSMA